MAQLLGSPEEKGRSLTITQGKATQVQDTLEALMGIPVIGHSEVKRGKSKHVTLTTLLM